MTLFKKFLTLSIFLQVCFARNSSFEESMISTSYQGHWTLFDSQNISPDSVFSKFTVSQGSVLIYFTNLGEDSSKVSGAIIEFLTPLYYDQQLVKMELNFQHPYDQVKQKWQGKVIVPYQMYDRTEKVGQGQSQYYYTLDQQTIGLNCPKQKITLVITYNKIYINPKVTLVFFFISIFVFTLLRRKYHISQTNIRHERFTVLLSSAFLMAVSVIQFIIGYHSLFGKMNPQAFFIVTSLFNFASFIYAFKFYGPIIFNKKYMIILSWLSIATYIWLLLYFRHSYIVLILNSLIFLPEVIFHMVRGQKIERDIPLYALLFTNQLYVIYFKSCPVNIFKQSPNYLLGYVIMGTIALSLFLLIGQVYLSPRFFIPSVCLPKRHNYYDTKNIKANLNNKKQCYICLQLIQKAQNKKIKHKLMITPCNHIFHASCLEKWMSVKMQCPTDRTALPPL